MTWQPPEHLIIEGTPEQRVQWFLESLQAVWMGRACLGEEGALYLGVPFRFPSLSIQLDLGSEMAA